jgi:hypothetical protein
MISLIDPISTNRVQSKISLQCCNNDKVSRLAFILIATGNSAVRENWSKTME